MVTVTRVVGVLLLLLGVGAYLGTGRESLTALLPALLGLGILVLGLIGAAERRRPAAIHAALVLALLGLLGTLPNVAQLGALAGGEAERPAAVVASTATAAVCLVYLILGVRSFIAARRERAGS